MRAGTPVFSLGLALGLLGILAGAASGQAPPSAAPVSEPAVAPPLGAVGGPTPIVAEVAVRADLRFEKGPVRQLLEAAVGQPLDAALARRLLKDLHAASEFEQIEILREDLPDGRARLVVVLRGLTRVAAVELRGELGLRSRVLKRRLRTMVGAHYDPRVVELDVAALRELYLRGHYREAKIETRIEPVSGERKASNVIFEIAAGPRARRGQVSIQGDFGNFPEATLREKVRSEPGQRPNADRLDGDRRRLRRFLRNEGHLSATVTVEESYDATRQELDAAFTVAAGPFIELVVTGIEPEKLRRRRLLAFAIDGPLDEISLEQSRQRIIEDLQRRGHYLARVAARLEPREDGGSRVLIDVEPGAQYRLEELTFGGAVTFTHRELARHVSTSPRQWWLPGSGKVNDVDLQADVNNLTSFYRLQGFDQATVGPADVETKAPAETPAEAPAEAGDAPPRREGRRDDRDGKGELSIDLPIVEGRRLRVVDLVFDGVTVFEPSELVEKLPLQPGSPFHPLLLDDTLNVVRALYEEEGYAWALVDVVQEWNPDQTLVELEFTVDEGPRLELDHLVVRDQVHTDPGLIRAAVALKSGEVLSRRRLLRAQRDLYRLGIFSRVEVRLAPVADSVEKRDVLVRVEEGTRWRLSYGVSYHSDDGIGGLLGVSRVNVGGDGGRLQLDARGSQRDRRLRLIYDRPVLGKLAVPLTTSIFLREENRPAFDVQETGVQLSLTRDFGRSRLVMFYDYRLVDLSQIPLDEELEREDAEVEISSITPDLLIDRRNDPINPTRGFSTNVRFEYAFPWLKADADFLKLFVQQTLYVDLGSAGVLAGSFRAGAIEPFSPAGDLDPMVPPDLESAKVPISERFFAGGRTTHRAYERDALGIAGESLLLGPDGAVREIGGNGMLLFNFDWRIPIAGAFGGVIFVDAGNVWDDWDQVDTKELRLGAGLGVRYLSPIGPVRVEVGWKLDRQPFEDSSPVILLSLGNPF